MSSTETPEPHASDPPDWGRFSPSEAELHNAQQEAARARREADEARREARDLSKRLERLEQAGPPSSEPVPAWQDKLQRGKDLGDDGLVRQAYAERDAAEDAQQLEQQRTEQAEADRQVAERAGWADYQAETARLAASDDPAERDKAADRLTHHGFVAQAKAKEIQAQVDAEVFAQMDAEAREHGWIAPGQHVDHDSWVQSYQRQLDQLARRGPNDIDAVKQTREVEAALERRIAELTENPAKASLTPGSQEVPPGVDHPQTMEGRLADAETRAKASGDWSEWDRLEVEATTRT